MLESGESEYAELTSSHYWRPPFVQGGLETRCKININIHSSVNDSIKQYLNALQI